MFDPVLGVCQDDWQKQLLDWHWRKEFDLLEKQTELGIVNKTPNHEQRPLLVLNVPTPQAPCGAEVDGWNMVQLQPNRRFGVRS